MTRPILDEETNFVYISDKLSVFFPKFYDALIKKFSGMGIRSGILHETKDIWCRDYMPIQMNDMSFVGYKYDPDYLKENFGHSEYTEYERKYSPIGARLRPWERVSALSEISVSHGIDISSRLRNYNIVLDGGNLVFCGNYVIVTDKILKGNKQSRDELESILREMFNLEPIIVHWEPDHEDVYGHTDGMFRALPTKKDEKPKLLYLHRWDSPSKRLRDNLRETAGDRIELKEIVFEKKGPGIAHWHGHISISFKWVEKYLFQSLGSLTRIRSWINSILVSGLNRNQLKCLILPDKEAPYIALLGISRMKIRGNKLILTKI